MGHNEMLIGRALKGRRDKALLSVKFGPMRSADGKAYGIDARPMAVKNFLAYTLTRLGVDHIDIYRPARLDPQVPIEDTVGAIAEMVTCVTSACPKSARKLSAGRSRCIPSATCR
jgi:aryl-alcohol dehydrogenase-like predicted oxidoreductase